MTLAEIFSKNYLFDPTPDGAGMQLYFLVFFGFLLAFGITIRYIKRLDEKIRKRQSVCYLTIGLLGFLYLFARHEGLPWIGSRFFLVLTLLTFIIWVAYIAIWMTRYIPKLKEKEYLEEKYFKYLPKGSKNHKERKNN